MKCKLSVVRSDGFAASIYLGATHDLKVGAANPALVDSGAPCSILPNAFVEKCESEIVPGAEGTDVVAGLSYDYHLAIVSLYVIDIEGRFNLPIKMRARVVDKVRQLDKDVSGLKDPGFIFGALSFLPQGALVIQTRDNPQEVIAYLRVSGDYFDFQLHMAQNLK